MAIVRGAEGARILGTSSALLGAAPAYQIRYTTDGSVPGPGSALHTAPISDPATVRAALVVDGSVVAALDETAPRLRIRGSTAPESRGKFHGH